MILILLFVYIYLFLLFDFQELRLKDEESFLKVFDDLEKKYTRGEKKLKVEYVRFIII